MLITQLFDSPLNFIALILALLIVLTFHEVAHGIAALWLGDTTAQDQGRLSFNPIKHLDPIGSILLLTVGFGWGKPVPVNYYNLRDQKWGPALVAAAGPFSNLLMLIIFIGVFKITSPGINPFFEPSNNLMQLFLFYLIIYSAILMVFNLIPIPPLDGSKVLMAALPERYSGFNHWLATRGPMLLLGLLIFDVFFSSSTGISVFSALFGKIMMTLAGFF